MLASFEGILGHETQKVYLSKVIEKNSLSHAYIFSGSVGTGKAFMAQHVVQHFVEGNIELNPNVQIIRRLVDEKTDKIKESISVEQIRSLKERLSMSSFGGGKKIAIIHEADRMTIAAQNALLKTLEEPTGDTHIFLLVSDPDALLETILSRSVHMRFARVAREEIRKFARAKGKGNELAHVISGIADGKPKIAEALLEKEGFDEYEEKIQSVFSFVEESLAERLRDSEVLAKSSKDRGEVESFLLTSRRVVHDVLTTALGSPHLCAFSDQESRLEALSQKKSVDSWVNTLKSVEESIENIRKNGNTTISLEHFALSI